MAQHLREGSVISYPSLPAEATVTNLTDAYIEFEYVDPTTSQTVAGVRTWATMTGMITVVSD